MTTHSAKRVLVVDDTEDMADLFAEYIRRDGCEPVTANDGFQAVEQAVRHKPDLILMDIRMPKMDGYEATRRILAIQELATTPIVAISAHCDGDWKERALRAGCMECLPKPMEPETLREVIERYTGGC